MALSIQTLNPAHQLDLFDCGRADLNQWLRHIARQHQKKRMSSTFVLIDDSVPSLVLGYYALTVCSVVGSLLPSTMSKKLPLSIPGVKLGRLATHLSHQRNGLHRVGETLLMDAMMRSKHISDNAGGYALFVDAIDESVVSFYERYGFVRLPDQPLTLFLPVDQI